MAKKRKEGERAADLEFVAEMYTSGYSYRQIASEIAKIRPYKISFQQVAKDVQKLLDNWQEEHQRKVDTYLIEQLRKLDHVEHEYWQAWQLSKSETLGNPSYLMGVERCIEKRSKLLGLLREKEISQSTPSFEFRLQLPDGTDVDEYLRRKNIIN